MASTTVPTFDQFIEPLLRVLADADSPMRTGDVYERVADRVGLSEEQRGEVLPSGRQPYYKNRIGWAHDRLKRAGLSGAPRRGLWEVTPEGRELADQYAAGLPSDRLRQIAFKPAKRHLGEEDEGEESSDDAEPTGLEGEVSSTPEERLQAAHDEIRQRVRTELLELVLGASPSFFERLVLDLLHAMGYGTSSRDLLQTGGTGDGGIDGVISLDRLGLEKVYVQAKRYGSENTVGRPSIQGFFGALAGRRATKGVFITTSRFSKEAREFASTASDAIVLINGRQLADLMIDFGVGVGVRQQVKVVEVDSDYFEEG